MNHDFWINTFSNRIYAVTSCSFALKFSCLEASWVVLVVKNLLANAGDIRDAGSIPGSGRSTGEGNGNPLQYSCLENPMDRGAWWATIHEVTKCWTWLNDLACMHSCFTQLYDKVNQAYIYIYIYHLFYGGYFFLSFFLFFFSHCTTWDVGSKFPSQGSNLSPLHCKCRVHHQGNPITSCLECSDFMD